MITIGHRSPSHLPNLLLGIYSIFPPEHFQISKFQLSKLQKWPIVKEIRFVSLISFHSFVIDLLHLILWMIQLNSICNWMNQLFEQTSELTKLVIWQKKNFNQFLIFSPPSFNSLAQKSEEMRKKKKRPWRDSNLRPRTLECGIWRTHHAQFISEIQFKFI